MACLDDSIKTHYYADNTQIYYDFNNDVTNSPIKSTSTVKNTNKDLKNRKKNTAYNDGVND